MRYRLEPKSLKQSYLSVPTAPRELLILIGHICKPIEKEKNRLTGSIVGGLR